MSKLLTRAAGTVAVALLATGLSPASATTQATAAAPSGNRSLATVLTSDGNRFDRNAHDYDVTTEAVLAVLEAKPDSAVGVLADGSQPLTAFVPTDRAFRRLVHALTGKWVRSERHVFEAVAGLGIDTVEQVLLYHVVPGSTIDRRAALASDGARLTTAAGPTVTVDVRRSPRRVVLLDRDPNAYNPRIVRFDLNRGNKQIAHAVNRVLRPADL
ncbi:fasciclin [Marmoricola sp. Leaf446]|uniref:Fasciclin domain-containing protein n=1 Tax=Nocardioides aurantiacus TaxID=86796 RepID=A0A3N2CVH7_9ACTN|nr:MULTISPECIES: fasciclin domain-containing protein [Nocardioidaceae]KQT89304.1 fasciclin [Marmoricola sp. Leaf446]ROR91489.1 fasciclin domain-containing protein [Nocardioides aurantiacus]